MASENKPLSRVDGDLQGLRNYGGSGHLGISKASQGSVSVVGTFILQKKIIISVYSVEAAAITLNRWSEDYHKDWISKEKEEDR